MQLSSSSSFSVRFSFGASLAVESAYAHAGVPAVVLSHFGLCIHALLLVQLSTARLLRGIQALKLPSRRLMVVSYRDSQHSSS